ncbi:MAG TPA: GtrA family protein [Rhizomicrobium sp.]|nr:GtrA family protein [Rhizomicrobium sp.]
MRFFRDTAARLFRSRFLRFGLVGAAGFPVFAAALFVAHDLLGISKQISWFPSFFIAATFTWWGNRLLTFREHAAQSNLLREWAKFIAANGLGALANLLLYTLLVQLAPPPTNNIYIAAAAGTLLGFLLNFTMSKRFVFRAGQ